MHHYGGKKGLELLSQTMSVGKKQSVTVGKKVGRLVESDVQVSHNHANDETIDG